MDVPELVLNTAASSSSSHGANCPATPTAVYRRPNKLKKARVASPAFSFVADDAPLFSHFPYSFQSPSSPSSFGSHAPLVANNSVPKRTASMPTRKLTKTQRPPPVSYHTMPPTAETPPPVYNVPQSHPRRRSTLSFSFRRRKSARAQSAPPVEHADPVPPPPVRLLILSSSPSDHHQLAKRATFLIGNEDSDDEEDERSLTQAPGRDITSSPPPASPPLSPRSATSVLPSDELEEQRRRRWTLMTDEAISDNDFAETVLSCNQCTSLDGHLYDEYPYDDLGLLHSPSLPNVDSVRRSTLLALLTTRDILRTERHYHTQMLILLHQTRAHKQWPVHPPPTVMHQRLLVLIATSERLLEFMEEDPSVNGIASALIHLEYEVSNALGDWCSIVGGWFDDDRRRKLSRHSRTLSARLNWSPAPPVPPLPPLPAPRAVSEPAPLLSPDSRKKMWRMSLPALPTLIQSSPQSRPKHTIQDLGILPVQRVTRYVLFFNGESHPFYVPSTRSLTYYLSQRFAQAHGFRVPIAPFGTACRRCGHAHCPALQ